MFVVAERRAAAKNPGVLVHKLRLQRGWSQEQLAELSALSVRTIQRIEKGQSASAESLKALAAVFEVELSNLLPESGVQSNANQALSPEEALALRQVRRIRGFYLHLMQYAFVITILAIINLASYPRYLWVVWVALGWGAGLIAHGLSAFDKIPLLGPEWEKRQVESRLGRKL